MVRTVVTPDQQNISIHLPKDYIGKKVEVIVIICDDCNSESYGRLDKPATHLASEQVLAKDWLTNDENKTWGNLRAKKKLPTRFSDVKVNPDLTYLREEMYGDDGR